ncbi:MAG: hypothetical protein ACR2P0_04650 [Acidimicrobiales bacterium]
MDRRIARRFVADCEIGVWIPKQGMLGRAKNAEFPAADLSQFGASVIASKSEGLKRGQVLKVKINDSETAAIVRNEFSIPENKRKFRYGLEFVQPSQTFLAAVSDITNEARRLSGENVIDTDLWLRSG